LASAVSWGVEREEDAVNDHCLDTLARALAGFSRRGLLAGAGALGAGLLFGGVPESVLGKKKRKKRKRCAPRCGPCAKCVGGRCKAVANRTPCGRCRECIGGACVDLLDGTICGTSCERCRGGACENVADDAACDGDGKCFAGVCNARPECAGVGGSCSFDEDCCGGNCNASFKCFGLPSMPDGAECQVNDDCVSGRCRGYRCTGAGLCRSKTIDFCADGTSWGDAEETCPCLLGDNPAGSFEFARPAAQPQLPGFSCGDCTKTQDCIDKWGPDAFCAFLGGTHCDCPQGQNRACVLPC
jgi:hypothetical protein